MRKNMIRLLTAGLVLIGCMGCEEQSLQIVQDGRSPYRIVVAADAVEGPKFAAEELQRYLQESTGVRIPIQTFPSAKDLAPDQPLIVIGQSDYTHALGISLKNAKPESFVIKTVGKNLIIAGHDTAGEPAEIKFEAKAGTLIGVYAFLRDELGVRWFMPGKLWEIVPKRNTLTVPPLDRLAQPDFLRRDPHRYRGMKPPEARAHALWARRNGCGMGILGHATHAWRRNITGDVFKDHPEWFALVGGKRTPYRDQLCCGQICSSNPDVVKIFIENTRRYFDENPKYDLCSISPNDGRGFCECERCTALDAPGSDSLTDRIFTFYAQVATEVGKTHPGKLVGGYAYSLYKELPKRVKGLPDNVFLVHVQNNTAFYSPEEAQHGLDLIEGWGRYHDKVSFYTFPIGSGFWSLPFVDTDWVRTLLPHLKKSDFLGIKLAALCYVNMQPDLYLYVRLLWDADADVDALLDDYYATLFGNVAPHIRAYHDTLRASYNNRSGGTRSLRGGRNKRQAVRDIYGPILPECRALLDKASAEAESDVIRRRVAVFSDNFHLAELLVTAFQAHQEMAEAKKWSAEELLRMKQACERWHAFVKAKRGTQGVDVISIERMRGANKILEVKHWDDLLRRKKRRK